MADTLQTAKAPVTWEQYAAMPQDGKQHQVIGGELIVSPAPRFLHQEVAGALYRHLCDFVYANELGKVAYAPVDVILSDTDIVQPDILFVGKQRLDIIADQVKGPPDLVVEVLSPSTVRLDTETKLALYARSGVPHYWIVNPDDRVVIAYQLSGEKYERVGLHQGDDAFAPALFEGLTLPLAEIWPRR
jgi:Uma2 family endonuclease